MYNTKTVKFEEDLIKLINTNNDLHISTIKLVLDKITNTVNEVLIEELEKEESQNTQDIETKY